MEWALAVVGLIAILMVAAVVVCGVFAARYYSLQERKWRTWIGARGWRAHRKWPQVLQHYTTGNLGKGLSARATKGYEGVFDGQAVAGFTYTYSTGTGPGEGKTFTHVCLLKIPGAHFPDLSISYDGWLNRIDRDDIQFEDAEFKQAVVGQQPDATFCPRRPASAPDATAHVRRRPRVLDAVVRTGCDSHLHQQS